MLIGIPEARVIEAVDSLIGIDVSAVAGGRQPLPQVDIVSGATVTVLVMGDSVLRAAIAVVRSGRLQELGPASAAAAEPQGARSIVEGEGEIRSCDELVGDGSVRRLSLSVGDVNEAFEQSGDPQAAARPERGEPDEPFIDLYVGLATVPTIGRSLLEDAAYEQVLREVEPGQHAIVVMGEGGRGPFCGWLCPFGALQELTNNAAQALKVPQIKVPWGVNERLWPLKYIIFLGLFGLSLTPSPWPRSRPRSSRSRRPSRSSSCAPGRSCSMPCCSWGWGSSSSGSSAAISARSARRWRFPRGSACSSAG